MPTAKECEAHRVELYNALDKKLSWPIAKAFAGGVFTIALIFGGFMYNVSCTANANTLKAESQVAMHSREYKYLVERIEALASELRSTNAKLDILVEKGYSLSDYGVSEPVLSPLP